MHIGTIRSKMKELKTKGFFHILLGGSLTKIIAFLSSILIVRFISKNEYAFLSAADNIYAYVYLVTGLGLDIAVLKYCVCDNKAINKAYFSYSFKLGTLVEIVIVAIAGLYSLFYPLPFPESKPYLLALILYPFLYYWVCLLQGFMRARLKNREYAYASIIQTIVIFAFSLGFVFLIGAYSIIVARYVGAVIAIIYIYKCIRDELKCESFILPREEKNKFLRFGLSLLLANVFSMIMPINETYLINNLVRDATITANYKVANLIPQQLTFFTSAIVTFYFPYFSRMETNLEKRKMSKKVGLLTFAIIGIITVVGIVFSPLVIRIVYGNKYNDIGNLMTILWVMHATNAGIRMLPMNILPAIGYTRFNVYMSVISCVVHFGIDFYCIKTFGVNGAVVAGCTVYVLSALCYWIYLFKKTA
ncbi:MAG: oligosaccharide flippase family protein [Clostridia bacterium]|nr:oligosaccharide flippase family protein [Clostridia bacterium]